MFKKIFFIFFIAFLFLAPHALADSVVDTVRVSSSDDYTEYLFPIGGKVYTALYYLGTVVVVDPENNYATSTITVSSNPFYIKGLDTKAYVTNYGSNDLTIIDTANGNTTTNVNVGSGPYEIVAVGSKLYVSRIGNDSVTIVDTANSNTTSTIGVGDNPVSMAVLGTKVYVNNRNSNNVTIIDTENTSSTTTIPVGNTPNNIKAIGDKIYVANVDSDNVTIIDTANGNATSTVGLGAIDATSAIVVNDTKLVIINRSTNNVTILDTANGNATSTVLVGNEPFFATAIDSKVYVANYAGNSVTVIDIANGNTTSTISVGSNPYAITSLDSKVYVYNEGDGTISVIETDSTSPTVSLSSPTSNQNVSGTISLTASASDNYSIRGVRFQVDGTNIESEDISSPYTISLDTSTLTNGSHVARAIARDSGNNYATSTEVSFTVSNSSGSGGGGSGSSRRSQVTETTVVTLPSDLTNLTSLPQNATREETISFITLKIQELLVEYNRIKTLESQIAVVNSVPVAGREVLKGFQFTKTFGIGANNTEVRYLQRFLNTHGFEVGTGLGSYGKEVDTFGPVTKATLIKYQLANGIEGTGYFGNLTKNKVNQVLLGE